MHDLGTLGGPDSYDTAINNGGEVAGYAEVQLGVDHAFLDSAGTCGNLGTLGGQLSWAYGINDQGEVVGDSYDASGKDTPSLTTRGAWRT